MNTVDIGGMDGVGEGGNSNGALTGGYFGGNYGGGGRFGSDGLSEAAVWEAAAGEAAEAAQAALRSGGCFRGAIIGGTEEEEIGGGRGWNTGVNRGGNGLSRGSTYSGVVGGRSVSFGGTGAASYVWASSGGNEGGADPTAVAFSGGNGGGPPQGGNPSPPNGETKGALGAVIPLALTTAALDGPIPVGDAVALGAITAAAAYDISQRTYITYTLNNPITGQIYVGRASGFGDPQSIMMNRFSGHHMRAFGFGNPSLTELHKALPDIVQLEEENNK